VQDTPKFVSLKDDSVATFKSDIPSYLGSHPSYMQAES
jgi:hypothetical protein